VQMGDLQSMFDDFKKLSGVKKIMSFGGWSFSTEADTAPIFRQGVSHVAVRRAITVRANFASRSVGYGRATGDVCDQCCEICQ
jgi:hypothetical protein